MSPVLMNTCNTETGDVSSRFLPKIDSVVSHEKQFSKGCFEQICHEHEKWLMDAGQVYVNGAAARHALAVPKGIRLNLHDPSPRRSFSTDAAALC